MVHIKEVLVNLKKDVSFTIWSNNPDFHKIDETLVGKIIYAKVQINEFAGKKNLILMPGLFECEDSLITNDMLITDMKYDIENDSKNYLKFLENHLSTRGYQLLKTILELDDPASTLFDEFKNCYAATTNHDNCAGGLMAHSYKCLRICEMLTNIYSWMRTFKTNKLTNEEFLDLLYIGLALHDLGKIKEINQDKYLYDSFNSHRILGFEMIVKHKETIINTYSEHFYNLFVSILIGHHNEFDDKAKTIYAYIAHKIDDLEAKFTDIDQRVDFDLFEIPNGQYIALEKDHKLFI